jgi:hypothetical protein
VQWHPTFEARVQESRPEDTIVAPAKGSEQATAAASEAPNSDKDKEECNVNEMKK